MRLLFMVLSFCLFFGSCYQEQIVYPNETNVFTSISFEMKHDQFSNILDSRNKSVNVLPVPKMFLGSKDYELSAFSTRGESTLRYQRKSFSVNMKKQFSMIHSKVTKPVVIDEFKLLSMVFDYTYIENKIGSELMRHVGLWPLVSFYTEVEINDTSQGLYYFVEDPENFYLKNRNYLCLLRRHYQSNLKYTISSGVCNDSLFVNHYNKIYTYILNYNGKELFEKLSAVINLQFYFRYIALNTLLGNGDYTDEVFFCGRIENNKIQPLEVLAWDMDDLFQKSPHEVGRSWGVGKLFGNRVYDSNQAVVNDIGEKLLFSVEEDLDYKIATDDFLYKKYLDQLNFVLNTISKKDIETLFQEVYLELQPFYNNKDVMYQSQHDEDFTTKDLWLVNMLNKKEYLLNRHDSLFNELHNVY